MIFSVQNTNEESKGKTEEEEANGCVNLISAITESPKTKSGGPDDNFFAVSNEA